jgi:hypothetical protein
VNGILKNACSLQAEWQERIGFAIAGAIGVALSAGVVAALIYFLLALGSLIASPAAYAQAAPPTAGVMLQAGIEKENVDGDLKAAMSIYEKIAKALLRLAGCDEKLGKQAKQVYEQILHDYADQPAAAQARTRLAVIKQQEHPSPPPTMTARRIEWAKLGQMGAADTDRERATFVDSEGNLFYGDVAGHNRRLVFRDESDWHAAFGWSATRDFSMMALAPPAKANQPSILAVVRMDGTGYRELLRDEKGEFESKGWIATPIRFDSLHSLEIYWRWLTGCASATSGPWPWSQLAFTGFRSIRFWKRTALKSFWSTHIM